MSLLVFSIASVFTDKVVDLISHVQSVYFKIVLHDQRPLSA